MSQVGGRASGLLPRAHALRLARKHTARVASQRHRSPDVDLHEAIVVAKRGAGGRPALVEIARGIEVGGLTAAHSAMDVAMVADLASFVRPDVDLLPLVRRWLFTHARLPASPGGGGGGPASSVNAGDDLDVDGGIAAPPPTPTAAADGDEATGSSQPREPAPTPVSGPGPVPAPAPIRPQLAAVLSIAVCNAESLVVPPPPPRPPPLARGRAPDGAARIAAERGRAGCGGSGSGGRGGVDPAARAPPLTTAALASVLSIATCGAGSLVVPPLRRPRTSAGVVGRVEPQRAPAGEAADAAGESSEVTAVPPAPPPPVRGEVHPLRRRAAVGAPSTPADAVAGGGGAAAVDDAAVEGGSAAVVAAVGNGGVHPLRRGAAAGVEEEAMPRRMPMQDPYLLTPKAAAMIAFGYEKCKHRDWGVAERLAAAFDSGGDGTMEPQHPPVLSSTQDVMSLVELLKACNALQISPRPLLKRLAWFVMRHAWEFLTDIAVVMEAYGRAQLLGHSGGGGDGAAEVSSRAPRGPALATGVGGSSVGAALAGRTAALLQQYPVAAIHGILEVFKLVARYALPHDGLCHALEAHLRRRTRRNALPDFASWEPHYPRLLRLALEVDAPHTARYLCELHYDYLMSVVEDGRPRRYQTLNADILARALIAAARAAYHSAREEALLLDEYARGVQNDLSEGGGGRGARGRRGAASGATRRHLPVLEPDAPAAVRVLHAVAMLGAWNPPRGRVTRAPGTRGRGGAHTHADTNVRAPPRRKDSEPSKREVVVHRLVGYIRSVAAAVGDGGAGGGAAPLHPPGDGSVGASDGGGAQAPPPPLSLESLGQMFDALERLMHTSDAARLGDMRGLVRVSTAEAARPGLVGLAPMCAGGGATDDSTADDGRRDTQGGRSSSSSSSSADALDTSDLPPPRPRPMAHPISAHAQKTLTVDDMWSVLLAAFQRHSDDGSPAPPASSVRAGGDPGPRVRGGAVAGENDHTRGAATPAVAPAHDRGSVGHLDDGGHWEEGTLRYLCVRGARGPPRPVGDGGRCGGDRPRHPLDHPLRYPFIGSTRVRRIAAASFTSDYTRTVVHARQRHLHLPHAACARLLYGWALWGFEVSDAVVQGIIARVSECTQSPGNVDAVVEGLPADDVVRLAYGLWRLDGGDVRKEASCGNATGAPPPQTPHLLLQRLYACGRFVDVSLRYAPAAVVVGGGGSNAAGGCAVREAVARAAGARAWTDAELVVCGAPLLAAFVAASHLPADATAVTDAVARPLDARLRDGLVAHLPATARAVALWGQFAGVVGLGGGGG